MIYGGFVDTYCHEEEKYPVNETQRNIQSVRLCSLRTAPSIESRLSGVCSAHESPTTSISSSSLMSPISIPCTSACTPKVWQHFTRLRAAWARSSASRARLAWMRSSKLRRVGSRRCGRFEGRERDGERLQGRVGTAAQRKSRTPLHGLGGGERRAWCKTARASALRSLRRGMRA